MALTAMRPGRLRSRSHPANSATRRGYDLPRRGRRPTRLTRSRSTRASPAEILVTADRRAYSKAIRILKRARAAAAAADEADQFVDTITALRDQHCRRPSLIAMLDKAELTGQTAA